MKKILLTLLVIFCGIFIGCNRDSNPSELENVLNFDGEKLYIENGYVLEYGLRNSLYYWKIIVTDGTYDDYSKIISSESTYLLEVNLFSTTNNLSGTFPYASEQTNLTRFFTSSNLFTDLTSESGISLESGSISVSGTLANLLFEVDAVANGTELSGNFEGAFKVEPGSFDEYIIEDSDPIDLYFGAVYEYGPINVSRTDGPSGTHFKRTVIITDVEFDIRTECNESSEIWIDLYSEGSDGPLEGIYNGENSFFEVNGYIMEYDEFWDANQGTITVTHDTGNNYYLTWDLSGYVYGGGVREEGSSGYQIKGEFKYSFDISDVLYCD